MNVGICEGFFSQNVPKQEDSQIWLHDQQSDESNLQLHHRLQWDTKRTCLSGCISHIFDNAQKESVPLHSVESHIFHIIKTKLTSVMVFMVWEVSLSWTVVSPTLK